MENKTIKDYAKEAKKRLKSGFWEDYKSNLGEKTVKAEEMGIAASKVQEYYKEKTTAEISTGVGVTGDEEFYKKVKDYLDEYGETPDILKKLMNESYFLLLPYEKRQKYLLELSSRYLSALERYKKEKTFSGIL